MDELILENMKMWKGRGYIFSLPKKMVEHIVQLEYDHEYKVNIYENHSENLITEATGKTSSESKYAVVYLKIETAVKLDKSQKYCLKFLFN